MQRRNLLFFALSLMCVIWSSGTFAGSEVILVVVNKSNPTSRLNKDELRQIFQTTKTTFPGGESVTPLNLPDDNSVRHDFDQAVLGLDPERVARYWLDRKIRGDARPPKKAPSPTAAVRTVAKTESALSYVPQSEASNEVKVVAKIANGKVLAP